RAVEAHPQPALEPGTPEPGRTSADWAAYRALLPPALLLLGVTLAGGAVLTFTPQMVSSQVLTTAGLFVMGFVAALTRWRAGLLADRHGAHRFVWPLVIVTALGMALIATMVR